MIINERLFAQEEELYWESDDYDSCEEMLDEVVFLLDGKAFVLADHEHDSTGECDTWVYLGKKDKNECYITHHEKGDTIDLHDDYNDGKVELKDILEEWGVSFKGCDPDVLKLIGIDNYKDNQIEKDNTEKRKTVLFGRYPQDSDDATDKQEIEWIILDEKKDRLLLISKYILDNRKYSHDPGFYAIWEEADIRKWLNTEFINVAFSQNEQDEILSVVHDGNSTRGLRFCGATEEKVFLLSYNEFLKYFDLGKGEEMAYGTRYAFSKGLQSGGYYFDGEGKAPADADKTSFWLLRTGGRNGVIFIPPIYFDLDQHQDPPKYAPSGIRVAIWKKK